MRNVAVIAEGNPFDPCNFVYPIRLGDPLKLLEQQDILRLQVCSSDMDWDWSEFDTIVVQRAPFTSLDALQHGLEELHKAIRAGCRLIYELDDHIFCPGLPGIIGQSRIDELDPEAYQRTQAHRRLLDLAHLVTCSTLPLANALKGLGTCCPVRVLRTGLDFSAPRWSLEQQTQLPAHRPFTIGWSGGSRVGRDLELLLPVLPRLFERFPGARFAIGGSTKYAELFEDFPEERLLVWDWVSYEEYPKWLRQVDVALIPMQDHSYNRCKSSLKPIDYGAMGIPAVCSPVAPFTDMKPAGPGLYLAESVQDWVAAVEAASSECSAPASRADLSARTRATHDLSNLLADYAKIYG